METLETIVRFVLSSVLFIPLLIAGTCWPCCTDTCDEGQCVETGYLMTDCGVGCGCGPLIWYFGLGATVTCDGLNLSGNYYMRWDRLYCWWQTQEFTRGSRTYLFRLVSPTEGVATLYLVETTFTDTGTGTGAEIILWYRTKRSTFLCCCTNRFSEVGTGTGSNPGEGESGTGGCDLPADICVRPFDGQSLTVPTAPTNCSPCADAQTGTGTDPLANDIPLAYAITIEGITGTTCGDGTGNCAAMYNKTHLVYLGYTRFGPAEGLVIPGTENCIYGPIFDQRGISSALIELQIPRDGTPGRLVLIEMCSGVQRSASLYRQSSPNDYNCNGENVFPLDIADPSSTCTNFPATLTATPVRAAYVGPGNGNAGSNDEFLILDDMLTPPCNTPCEVGGTVTISNSCCPAGVSGQVVITLTAAGSPLNGVSYNLTWDGGSSWGTTVASWCGNSPGPTISVTCVAGVWRLSFIHPGSNNCVVNVITVTADPIPSCSPLVVVWSDTEVQEAIFPCPCDNGGTFPYPLTVTMTA